MKLYLEIRKGIIEKLLCIKCGRQDSHGHHDDYNKPFEVVWLCPIHYKEAHKLLRDEEIHKKKK